MKSGKLIKLGKTGRKFRKKVLNEYVFTKTHDLEKLDMASQILDRLELCNAEIEANSAFILGSNGQLKENPAMKSERDLKVVFCRIIRELNMDIEELKNDNRPPKLRR